MKKCTLSDSFPNGIFPASTWLNAVSVKPDIDPVAFQILAEPINLFLVFPDIRDKDVAWLLVVHFSNQIVEMIVIFIEFS